MGDIILMTDKMPKLKKEVFFLDCILDEKKLVNLIFPGFINRQSRNNISIFTAIFISGF